MQNVKYIEKCIFCLILRNVTSQKIQKIIDIKISNIFVTVTIFYCKPLIMFCKKIQYDRENGSHFKCLKLNIKFLKLLYAA